MFYFSVARKLPTVRSEYYSKAWCISLTVIICFKKQYLLSTDLSASWLLGLTLWLLCWFVLVTESPSNCSSLLPNELLLILLKWETSVNYKSCQFKLLGMTQVGRSEWQIPPQVCINASKLDGFYLCLCLPSVGGKGVHCIPALGFLILLTIKLNSHLLHAFSHWSHLLSNIISWCFSNCLGFIRTQFHQDITTEFCKKQTQPKSLPFW